MEKVSFGTTIVFDNSNGVPKSWKEALLESSGNLFYFGGRKVKVMTGQFTGTLVNAECPLWQTIVKIALCCTLIIPLIALAIKLALQSQYSFQSNKEHLNSNQTNENGNNGMNTAPVLIPKPLENPYDLSNESPPLETIATSIEEPPSPVNPSTGHHPVPDTLPKSLTPDLQPVEQPKPSQPLTQKPVLLEKPQKVQNLPRYPGEKLLTYASGVTEQGVFTVDAQGNVINGPWQGIRLFPGKKQAPESGQFAGPMDKLLNSDAGDYGKAMIRHIPKFVKNGYVEEDSRYIITQDGAGPLLVMKNLGSGLYLKMPIPVLEALQKACEWKFNGGSVSKILQHKDLDQERKNFIEKNLSPQKLSDLSSLAIMDLLECAQKEGLPIAQQLLDPKNKNSIFIFTASRSLSTLYNENTLAKLKEKYKEAFEAAKPNMTLKFLELRRDLEFVNEFVFSDAQSLIMPHIALCLLAAEGKPIDQDFRDRYALLSQEDQESVSKIAKIYNNPIIPKDKLLTTPITPDQFSLNFMWLYNSPTKRQEDAMHLARWAKMHPGTPMTIWIDNNQIDEASRQLVEKEFRNAWGDKTAPLPFKFIDVHTEFPKSPAFLPHVKHKLREDFLRAKIADKVLTEEPNRYFVCANFHMSEMPPFSRDMMFNQSTMESLTNYGFMLGKKYPLCSEAVQILNPQNKQFMTSHQQIVIQLNEEVISLARQMRESDQEQVLYTAYLAMFTHILQATNQYGNLFLLRGETEESAKDDLRVFNYYRFWDRLGHGNGEIPLDGKEGEKVKFKDLMPLIETQLET